MGVLAIDTVTLLADLGFSPMVTLKSPVSAPLVAMKVSLSFPLLFLFFCKNGFLISFSCMFNAFVFDVVVVFNLGSLGCISAL